MPVLAPSENIEEQVQASVDGLGKHMQKQMGMLNLVLRVMEVTY